MTNYLSINLFVCFKRMKPIYRQPETNCNTVLGFGLEWDVITFIVLIYILWPIIHFMFKDQLQWIKYIYYIFPKIYLHFVTSGDVVVQSKASSDLLQHRRYRRSFLPTAVTIYDELLKRLNVTVSAAI